MNWSHNDYEEQLKFLRKETSPIMVKSSGLQIIYLRRTLDTIICSNM
jgi:hypothetical protein